MKDYDSDPSSVWKSEMFGRRLYNIVQEGIMGKLSLMPDNIRNKLQTTLTKVVNKGSNNMIAIVIQLSFLYKVCYYVITRKKEVYKMEKFPIIITRKDNK